ncbi:MAG: N-acetyltransferase, partial [Oscillospiraceae bacterium]
GAVVACNVPDYALMLGVPAKFSGWVCECGELLKEKSPDGTYTCKKCGRKYAENNETLSEI